MTKVKIVFDASAKIKAPSQNELCVEYRFNGGYGGYREGSYMQIAVSPTENDYLRFLWYDDVPKKNLELANYCFMQVIFGATCSQFLLNNIVNMHAEINQNFTTKM